MLRRLTILAVFAAAPAALVAQSSIPNEHASPTAVAKVQANRPTLPTLPEQASATAKSRLEELGALQIRGSVVGLEQRPVWVAVPAGPSQGTPPSTVGAGGPPSERPPVTIATPAAPPNKPASPGQSGSHRP